MDTYPRRAAGTPPKVRLDGFDSAQFRLVND